MATLVLDNTLYQGYATIAEQNNISVTDAMAEALRLLKQHLKKKSSLSLRQRLEKRILEHGRPPKETPVCLFLVIE